MNQLAKRQGVIALTIIFAVLVIDQIVKIWVKTHMCLDESIQVTDWFYIRFIENSGMAWGMTFFNKIVLSLFRIIAVILIGGFIWKLIKKGKSSSLYIILLSMVLAGAAGNIIDSMVYGLVFNGSSQFFVSYFVPFGTGYGEFLTGKVVDMFYFPLITSTWPNWVPLIGGQQFTFFNAIFNVADASISVGVICLLLFCRKELALMTEKSNKKNNDECVSDKKSE
nr:lipoprotein signal peptidase [Prevotella sp.]